MIDPHVHLRDWEQAQKETVKHGLQVAYRAGLDAVFEMPNTAPPLISEATIRERIRLADAAGVSVFHGVYAGLTTNNVQEMVRTHNALFPRVVGLKLFAGKSTGELSVIDETAQQQIFLELAQAGYKGVLAVHCEKEALFRNELWDAAQPHTHSKCRPPASEEASVHDMLRFANAAQFRGTLHICHISTPGAVHLIEAGRHTATCKLTCGITPHHALLDYTAAQHNPLLKINPPLREKTIQEQMLALLIAGKIDWIETDHAPHTLQDKPGASGIPGLPYYPRFIRFLQSQLPAAQLDNLTHNNINAAFGLEIINHYRPAEMNLAEEYPFDPFKNLP